MDIFVLCMQSAGAILSFLFIVYVARQRQSQLRSYLFLFSVAVFLNLLSYLFEITSKTIEAARMAIRFEYIVGSAATVVSVLFVCEMFQVNFRPWLRTVYISLFVITCSLVCTNDLHHLHYIRSSLEVREHFSALQMEVGVVYLAHTTIMLMSMAVNIGIITAAWLRDAKWKEDYKKYVLLVIAVAMPLLFWSIRFAEPVKDYDFIPFGLFCVNCCFVLIIHFFHIFDVAENAKNEVLEGLEEGILVCDDEGNVLYANTKLRGMFKRSNFRNLAEVLCEMDSTEEGDFFIGDRLYSVIESEVYEGSKVKGKTLCFIDVTQSREKEHELKELHQVAMAANNAKSNFLANMSHEIRTPINTILGMGELILREARDINVLEYAENIKTEGKTLMSLINDLLDFSKIESGKMELSESEYSIASLIHDVVIMFSIKAEEKGLEFHVNVAEDIPAELFGDELRIKQILNNLLSNAVKYTERGDVWLNVEWNLRKEATAELLVTVRDSGIGIHKEDLSKIFEKFKRLDSERTGKIEGTGLGMSITAQLLELMNGEISIDSEYGIGSEFKVRIPQRIVNAAPIGSHDFAPQKKGKNVVEVTFTAPHARVLVVDDNVMNRVVIRGLLKRTLLQIDEAENGVECLEKTMQNHYDIILLDHMMPGMDGVETLRNLKKQEGKSKDAVVIVLTANAVVGVKDFYLGQGFDDYMSKPISGTKLEEMLLHYLPEEMVLRGEVATERFGMKNAKQEGFRPEEIKSMLLTERIDMDGSMENFSGDEAMYREAALLFCSLQEERLGKLHAYIRTEDALSYSVLVHAIKGDARMLGLGELEEVAYEQEKMAKEGNLSFLLDKFGVLSSEYQRASGCFWRIFGTVRGGGV